MRDWKEIEPLVREELAALCGSLESREMNHDQTQFVRGQIAALRRVVSHANPSMIITNETPDYTR